MILIPAIDLKEGHCVRLRQGNMDESTVFSDDPVAMAGKWAALGCTRLHLVDLDAWGVLSPGRRRALELGDGSPLEPLGPLGLLVGDTALPAGVRRLFVALPALRRPRAQH